MVRLTSSLAVLILVFGISSWASGEVVFQDDFDSYTTGLVPPNPPWNPDDLGVIVQVVEVDSSGFSGKSVHLLDQSSSDRAALSHSFASTPVANYVLQYDMLTSSVSHGPSVWVYGDAGGDYAPIFRSTGDIGIIGGGGWVEEASFFMGYEVDTWYSVCRTLDLAANAGQFEIWKKDDLSTKQTYRIGYDAANTYIDRIRLETSVSLLADGKIDKIELHAIHEPSTIILLLTGGAGLLAFAWRRRRAV